MLDLFWISVFGWNGHEAAIEVKTDSPAVNLIIASVDNSVSKDAIKQTPEWAYDVTQGAIEGQGDYFR